MCIKVLSWPRRFPATLPCCMTYSACGGTIVDFMPVLIKWLEGKQKKTWETITVHSSTVNLAVSLKTPEKIEKQTCCHFRQLIFGQVTIYRWLVLIQICQNQRRCTNDLEKNQEVSASSYKPLKQWSSVGK